MSIQRRTQILEPPLAKTEDLRVRVLQNIYIILSGSFKLTDMMNRQSRPDLSNQSISVLVVVTVIGIIIALSPITQHEPGSPAGQWAALLGTIALLTPALFSLMKRSGVSDNPPFWFITHVVCATIGVYFILFHAGGGDWLSPPGIVLFLMLFLVIQGAYLRVAISDRFAHLFARSAVSGGFGTAAKFDKAELQALIEQKQRLLKNLDSDAEEALFSPALRHWLTHPRLTLRYQRMVEEEAQMIGARASAGFSLAWSRRIHMIAAALFFIGLVAHVITVLFFAGYAAGGDQINWWYITDWGK